MSTDLIIILAFVAISVLLLRNKKAKEAKMGQDYDNMMKEGNFRGLKIMFRRQFLIWGILFLFALTVSVIRLTKERGDIRGLTELIVSIFFGYRAFSLWRVYKSFKDAGKYLSYRLSDEEIENFWKEENDEELVSRLYDYIQKKSYNSLINALTAVNASETAGICAKAPDIISRGLLKDQESDLLYKECDLPFCDKTENLTSLIAEYARNNKDSLLS